jgi:hypothetical protein
VSNTDQTASSNDAATRPQRVNTSSQAVANSKPPTALERLDQLKRALQRRLNRKPTAFEKAALDNAALLALRSEIASRDPASDSNTIVRLTTTSLKKRVEELQREASDLRSEIVNVEVKLKGVESELAKKREKHAGLIIRLNEEIAQVEAAARLEQVEIDVAEFHAVARKLDAEGESPGLVARFFYLCKALRSARRLGQSHEAVTLTIRRLRSEPGTQPLSPQLRTWSAVARAWCPPQEVAAA